MTLHSNAGKTEAELDAHEVLLLANVLNEVCNGFTVPDFGVTFAVSESKVHKLFERIQVLKSDGPVRVELTKEELSILQNALRESLRELGLEEFSIRTGIPFDFGQAALRELQTWTSK